MIHRAADAAYHTPRQQQQSKGARVLGNALPNAKTPGYSVRTLPHARRLRGLSLHDAAAPLPHQCATKRSPYVALAYHRTDNAR
ncbi:MAG: hypothetical protein QOJ64_1653 [Acidobacteriota bacterium]|jgi:hypothetical protein|nr:hypothetical protein [Acidobacteriota bacterium]